MANESIHTSFHQTWWNDDYVLFLLVPESRISYAKTLVYNGTAVVILDGLITPNCYNRGEFCTKFRRHTEMDRFEDLAAWCKSGLLWAAENELRISKRGKSAIRFSQLPGTRVKTHIKLHPCERDMQNPDSFIS